MRMAKVMISLPDEVLEGLDAHAAAIGESRSGFLRELAERELESARGSRAEEVRRLLARPARRGGESTTAIREARRSR